MKILLVLPDANIHKLSVGPLNISFREAPLTATTLAALVPEDLDAEVSIIDESVSNIPFDTYFDIVGISVLTGTAVRAYEIADRFREKDVTVVLGGVHVTLIPDEAKKHADAIVIGFAEQSWPQLLHDFAMNIMQPVYKQKNVFIEKLPIPRRDLQKRMGYMAPNTVFATRGCKAACDFCSVPAAKFGWHKRPIPDVIDEIRQIKSKRIVFNDVHLVEDVEYAKELFKAMIPLKKKWGGLATTRIGNDEEMLDLMRQSGCVYLLLGFESINTMSLNDINKRFNNVNDYRNVVEKLHDRNIIIQGCFIFGMDQDDKYIFDCTVQTINDIKIDIPRFAIYTPYPNTTAFKRLKKEGRILHEYWPHYDTQHVVFQPAKMSPVELDNGFRLAYRETFKIGSVLNRALTSAYFPITFFGNLAYQIYIWRLQHDPLRIYQQTYYKDALCHT